MKIECLGVTRWNKDTVEPVVLDAAFNLADYGYFQRSSVKEFLTFALRTLAKRLPPGVHGIDYEGKLCYCFMLESGLGGIAICDKEYPSRVAVTLLREIVNEVKTGEHSATWKTTTVDGGLKIKDLETTLAEYQDPVKVDKIMKVDKSLTETKEVLTKTIEAVLERGEKLDDLVEKSTELSKTSKAFYKTAKSTNSCCVIS